MSLKTISLAFALLVPMAPANACAVWTGDDLRRMHREQDAWLRREADRVVTGVFHVDPPTVLREGVDEDSQVIRGVIEVNHGRRLIKYRISVYDPTIGCGFPNNNVQDGIHGRFYLEQDEESDDSDDGVIDNFHLIHFRSLVRERS
jgi:hypothetical protein